jgi:hypothetical protein
MAGTLTSFPINTKDWSDFTNISGVEDADLMFIRRGTSTQLLQGTTLKQEMTKSTTLAGSRVDTGVANAYILNPPSSISPVSSLINGMRFRAFLNNASTGATTVNIDSIGVKSVVDEEGNALTDQITTTIEHEFRYDSGNDRFVLVNNYDFGASNTSTLVTFTSSGTYNRPDNVKSIEVWVQGGGGAGRASGTTSLETGGGGGGGCFYGTLDFDSIPSSVSITIGSGGTSAGNGGTSSFGALFSATGGEGGRTDARVARGGGGSGSGLIHYGNNGDIESSFGGGGGNSVFGLGGQNGSNNATGYGAGGGGRATTYHAGSSNAGTAGIVVIKENY